MTTCGLPNREGGGHGSHSKNESDAIDVTAICEVAALRLFNLPSLRHETFGVGRGRCVGLNSTSDAHSRYIDLSTKLFDSSGGDPALSEVSRSHAPQSMRAPCICQRIIGYR